MASTKHSSNARSKSNNPPFPPNPPLHPLNRPPLVVPSPASATTRATAAASLQPARHKRGIHSPLRTVTLTSATKSSQSQSQSQCPPPEKRDTQLLRPCYLSTVPPSSPPTLPLYPKRACPRVHDLTSPRPGLFFFFYFRRSPKVCSCFLLLSTNRSRLLVSACLLRLLPSGVTACACCRLLCVG